MPFASVLLFLLSFLCATQASADERLDKSLAARGQVEIKKVAVTGSSFGTIEEVLRELDGVRIAYSPDPTEAARISTVEADIQAASPGTYDAPRIEAIRMNLTRAFIAAGYVSSGATVDPAQDIADGVLTLTVVEGELGVVRVTGGDGLNPQYIEDRVRVATTAPFNLNQVGRTLQVLLQDPLVRSLKAEVKPGIRPGVADLGLALERHHTYDAMFTVANDRSPSIGSVREELRMQARNLTGWGDTVGVSLSNSEGLVGGGVDFSVPVTPYDTRVAFSAQYNESTIIEEPFQDIDIGGDSLDLSLQITHPLYRTPTEELAVGLSLDRRESTTTLLGEPFSFSPGVIDGVSKVSATRFSQSWTLRDKDQILAFRSVFGLGVDVATDSAGPTEPDSQFFVWLGQAQWAQRVQTYIEPGDLRSTLIVRADMQWAEDDLLPMEKLSLGGVETVRGYRNNTLVRDSGVNASIELQVPVFRWQAFADEADLDAGKFVVSLFVDGAYAGNRSVSATNPEPFNELASAGVGLQWSPLPHLSGQFYYGYALLNKPDPTSKDLQDEGIHFAIKLNVGEVVKIFHDRPAAEAAK